MKKAVGFLLSMLVVCAAWAANIETRTEAREYVRADGTGIVFRYRWAEKTPADGSKVPLVFFLHGAGERGDNNVSQLHHGVADIVAWLDANEAGFKFVAGQVPVGKRWVEVDWGSSAHTMPVEPSETMTSLLEFMDTLLADESVDTNRVYATGISMGGYGTWDLISRRPEVFAAAIPICGGADLAQAPKLASMPIWTFHGSKDTSVPVSRSRNMMSALWAVGSDAHYWEHPDAPHNVWTRTYQNDEVLTWFFAQTKSASSGGGSGGDTPTVGPTEIDLGDVRLESETFTLAAQSAGAIKNSAGSFAIAPGAGMGGLDRIVVTGSASTANAHLDIGEFVREGNALLDVHAQSASLLGQAVVGTVGTVNVTYTNGVAAIGEGVTGSISTAVVPWARGAISGSAADVQWTQLVTYDAETGFRFLEPETDYQTYSYVQDNAVPTDGANVRVTAPGVVDFAGSSSVNSLSMLSSPSATTTVYVTNGTMRIASGVLDLSSSKDNATVNGNFDFGEATGYITYYHAKKAALAGSIAGTDVVIADSAIDQSASAAGKGLLTVSASGTFTGDLYVNGSATITGSSFVPSGARKGNVIVNGKLFVDAPTINGLYGSGIVDKPYTGTKTFTLGDNDADGDFSGTIVNSKGNYSFLKKGTGSQKFGGAVTVGGQFNVSAGTIELTGTLACGQISIASGASFVINFEERASMSSASARKFITSTTSMEGLAFEKGENVQSIELRENGTELWATPRVTGFAITIAND